jgi:cytochrome c-type biogenesis protein CcmH
MLFFVFAVLITAACVYALVRPLLGELPPPAPAERFNSGVYRDQLAELDGEVARQAIPEGEAAGVRLEIQRRLLAASRALSGGETRLQPAPRAAAIALAVVIVLLAGGLYALVGHPLLPDQPLAARHDAGAGGDVPGPDAPGPDAQAAAHPDMAKMVEELVTRLQRQPNDADGWALLARSLVRLNRMPEAVTAYRRAMQLTGGDPQIAAEYGEARVLASGGSVDLEALGVFERLLARDPGNPQARFYIALGKAQKGDTAGALADWRKLTADSPKDAPWLPTVQAKIAEVEQAQRGGGAMPDAVAQAGAEPSGPTPDQMAAAAQMSESDRAAMVRNMVSGLAARLQKTPDDLDGWRRLARAYQVLGQPADAARAYRQVLRLAPDDPAARAALQAR